MNEITFYLFKFSILKIRFNLMNNFRFPHYANEKKVDFRMRKKIGSNSRDHNLSPLLEGRGKIFFWGGSL